MKDITHHFQNDKDLLVKSINNLTMEDDYEFDVLEAQVFGELHRKFGIISDILTVRGYIITSSLKGKMRKIIFKKG